MKNKIKMPEKAKNKFILWCKRQTTNPYDLIHYGIQPESDLVKMAGEQLLGVWSDLNEFLMFFRCSHFLYVFLENLPVNKEGEEKFVSEFMCIALAYVMRTNPRIGIGEKFPFNSPMHRVTPEIGYEKEDGVNNGAGTVKLHNDRMFIDEKIKYLLLYGVRKDKVDDGNVPTFFVPVAKLIEGIPEDLYLNLFEKNFKNPESEKVIAALRGDPNKPETVESNLDLNDGWMIPLTQGAKDSLEWLQRRSDEIMQYSNYCEQLGPGTCAIAKDRLVVHARSSFETSNILEERRLALRLHLIEITTPYLFVFPDNKTYNLYWEKVELQKLSGRKVEVIIEPRWDIAGVIIKDRWDRHTILFVEKSLYCTATCGWGYQSTICLEPETEIK